MGKVVLVTGASRGIGKAICAHLALKGYDIVVTSRSVQPRDVTPFPGTIGETAALVESLGARALAIRCDAGKSEDLRSAVQQTIEAFGSLDILINNARHEGPYMWGWFKDVPPEDMQVAVNVNMVAPVLLCRYAIPQMIKQGGGLIINVTSGVLHSIRKDPPGKGKTGLLYPLTKTGMDALTYGLAPELMQEKIAVASLQPGRTLIERPTGGKADYFGTNLATRHTVHVPAVAVTFLATCPDPMAFTGQVIDGPAFVRERGLMKPDEITTPFREGQIYDPYAEPYWKRLVAVSRRR